MTWTQVPVPTGSNLDGGLTSVTKPTLMDPTPTLRKLAGIPTHGMTGKVRLYP